MPKRIREAKKETKDQREKTAIRSSRQNSLPKRKLQDAYSNYLSARKELLTKEAPELSHTDILKIVGREWKEMPIEEQGKYVQMKREEVEVVLSEPTQTQKEEPLASGAKNSPPEAPLSLPLCEVHGEEYKYWCKNCSEWICEFCVTTHSSNTHSCIHMLDFAQRNLLSDVEALFKQTKASSEASGQISDELVRIVGTLKRLIATYASKIQELNKTVDDVEKINRNYKAAWQAFENDLKEIKESTPALIENKNQVRIYEFLDKIDCMKRITQSDNFDIKLLTNIRGQLEEYITTTTDPLNTILENIEELIKALTFTCLLRCLH
eukprot:TRINITY_DN9189_c0_g1_i4.p1 TRINITY_DN9189_c0_g1~~TRINITY_DN9189_c0_g1_i4.p1  ORF type:complete len:323 (+),score=67.76 TRINITY_DN9189_c0_g1_i4:221-1189(+)